MSIRTIHTLTIFLFFVVFMLFFCPPPTRASVIIQRPLYLGLTQGLVGFWSFDGADMAIGNGILTAYDRSGNGNNGALTKIERYTLK